MRAEQEPTTMVDLTPVGLSKDGRMLLLVSERGEEFSVRVDHRLRSALKGDLARLGQLEMTMESTLRPRDIQTRIRAGESAEEVAAAAGTSVEKIMGFAGPVLAERAHVAESAQASSVRRRSGESSGARVLSESVAGYLRTIGAHAEDVAWDAWRREDGRWTIVADLVSEGRPRHAEFCYDMPGRYVVAENDEARLLTGETAPGAGAPAPASPRRLSAVPSAQDELPLGDDAIELVREEDGAAAPEPAEEPTADDAATDPSADSEHTDELVVDHGDADWIAREEPSEQQPAAETGGPAGKDAQPSEQPEATRRGRKKRSSVPSWDEIMFGGGGAPE